uniref:ribbon-helix-helix domain-containing protein n=1 Tax=Pararhizobium sp. IMCC3301 TaxID=3067904 RepID=UPI00274093C9|nr:ribbon-helix-helix domain-containing protein [Pararhizobium sp. IMCC3301]
MKKHSISIEGHRTSISLEDAFWTGLQEIARLRDISLQALIREVDEARTAGLTDLPSENLSSAIRVMVLRHYQQQGR